MTMIDNPDPQTPFEVLDNFDLIVRRDRLVRGAYFVSRNELGVHFDVNDPAWGLEQARAEQLANENALCGGGRACAIGSLWLAGGVKTEPNFMGTGGYLPHVVEENRHLELDERPALSVAYDALNLAATELLREMDEPDAGFDSSMEQLFENVDAEKLAANPYTLFTDEERERILNGGYDRFVVSRGLVGLLLECSRRARLILDGEPAAVEVRDR
jgi:hypothetical protein